jgi:Flp pilus assembly protein TadG
MRVKSLAKQLGADIVEFIVTLPVMMILFFIVIGFGVVVTDWAVVANASRAAAREAIRNTDPTNTAVFDAADAALASLIIWRESNPYTCTRTCSQTTCPNSCNCSICPFDRTATGLGTDVYVTVRFPVQLPIPWLHDLNLGLASTTHMSMMLN